MDVQVGFMISSHADLCYFPGPKVDSRADQRLMAVDQGSDCGTHELIYF
jgi:hypothetical protein